MNAVETVFGIVVLLLASSCVILALTVLIVWLWTKLRQIVAANHRPTPEETFWREHAALDTPRRWPS